MPKPSVQELSAVSETLLFTLHFRATESRRVDAMVRDPKAVELIDQIDYDYSVFGKQRATQVTTLMRVRQFDQYTRAFLDEHPAGTVVEIGCGLSTRFYRVDDGAVEWYDLDFPEVIALRRRLLGEPLRSHYIGCSALNFAWMDALSGKAGADILFLAEGVLPYLEEADARRLVVALQARFPGARLVFDSVPPFLVKLYYGHPLMRKVKARLRWGLRRGDQLEAWDAGLRLLDEWFYFDQPEPRLGWYWIWKLFPPLGKGYRIVQYQLG